MKCELRPIIYLGRERWGIYDSHGTFRQWATEEKDARNAAKQIERLSRENEQIVKGKKRRDQDE